MRAILKWNAFTRSEPWLTRSERLFNYDLWAVQTTEKTAICGTNVGPLICSKRHNLPLYYVILLARYSGLNKYFDFFLFFHSMLMTPRISAGNNSIVYFLCAFFNCFHKERHMKTGENTQKSALLSRCNLSVPASGHTFYVDAARRSAFFCACEACFSACAQVRPLFVEKTRVYCDTEARAQALLGRPCLLDGQRT